jgi:tetratricopeptide (TPR) repeat protein
MRTLAFSILALCLLAPTPARPEDAKAELSTLLDQADLAYGRRDEPGALDEVRSKLEEALTLAPDDYEVLWRQARLEFWISDDPALPPKEKSRAGKLAWELGDRATRADPTRVEGWNYAAAGMGNYALGIGVLQALGEGIEAKFKERLGKAEKLDPSFEHGALQTAWGRFWFKLPWPKYDAKRCERALKAALEMNPDNVRAHVYLADLFAKEGKKALAREELEKAAESSPGKYDAPEERRMQAVAKAQLERG